MQLKSINIDTWDGGFTDDIRNAKANVFGSVKHFDNYSHAHKLVPYRNMVADATNESDLATIKIQKFILANGKFYGLGIKSTFTQIYVKTTQVPNDAWIEAAGTSIGSHVDDYLMFNYYQTYLYGTNSAGIWKYGDITGSPTVTENVASAIVSGTKATGQGFVSPKYNILYVPSNNLLIQNSSGTWSTACTFPVGSIVLTPCEYGSLIAIPVINPDSTNSIYLWDTQTSVNDFTEKIDAGIGKIKFIESTGGVLTWVMVSAIDTTSSIDNHVFFKYWSGSQVIQFEDFSCDSSSVIFLDTQKFNSLLYFMADMSINGVVYRGVWKIYKKENGQLAISFDRLPRNDTVLDGGSNVLLGFYRWGDYMFIAYKIPTTGAFTVWRPYVNATYTATSIIETSINQGMTPEDSKANKKLMVVALSSEPLTSGQQLVLKYRVDNTVAGAGWTTILTQTTVGTVTTERTRDASGIFFTGGREYEFRIESTGGAQPTKLGFKWRNLKTH